ncbi:MAG: carboxypeptidase-like regulatory domain-containing protein [Bacteroidetes bacterium]|nr:carboxypeptidase-like regulatory domain-containing protein [Bacteroidota bacterium]
MRYFFLLICNLLVFSAFSQRTISGTVKDIEGNPLIGAFVQEVGTPNGTMVLENDGSFNITTTKDGAELMFELFSYCTQTRVIISTTTELHVRLMRCDTIYYQFPRRDWLSFGAQYGVVSSMFGLSFSNCYDEQLFIHFESIDDTWQYKINAQTNFQKDYSFGANIRYRDISIRRLHRPISVGYQQYDYISNDFFHQDIYLSTYLVGFWRWGVFSIKAGYQRLNDFKNAGASIILGQWIYDNYRGGISNGLRAEISAGYYFDYFTFSANLYGVVFKNYYYRLSYDRIDKHDFFTVGVNYFFRRK